MLAEARASIERHRKVDLSIRVEDAMGAPVRNAKVRVEQLRHEFLFGCNLFAFNHCATPDQEQEYRSRFAALFNYCTLGFYWASFESERGKSNYAYIDRVVEWTKDQGITCKGHPLVWDHPAGSPPWLPDDPKQIAGLVRERVQSIVSRYRGRIDFWDVVNEATHLPDGMNHTRMAAWGAGLGPVPYAGEPLKTAREANPDATLLVNDYRTDPPYLKILSSLRAGKGYLMDAVGIQSHMHDGMWPLQKLYSVCETYAKLRLPIHFTETTILSGDRENGQMNWGPSTAGAEATQAEQAATFYTLLFAHPAVQAITWWDFSDYHAWQRAPAGLLHQDMTPKPAFERLADLVRHQWWTSLDAVTDEKGLCSMRGFCGQYRLTAQLSSSQKITSDSVFGHNRSNQVTLRI